MIKQIFVSLGNNRPKTLVRLEDCVLEAVIGLSEGKSRELAMYTLYSEIESLEKGLREDKAAMEWFNLSKKSATAPSTLPPLDANSIQLPGVSVYFMYSIFF